MQTIKTQHDIDKLHHDRSTPAPLVNHIEVYFQQLKAELANDGEASFSLDSHGPIFLLERGDDLSSLNFTGLNDGSSGFLCRAVEFVERLDLGELQAYRFAALLDNDFLVTFFTLAGTHNEEVEQWLIEQAQRS